MKLYTEMYGADADGNRGVMTTFYELEETPTERREIAEILYWHGIPSDDKGYIIISYEGVEIEVEISDYAEEIKRLEDEENG